MDAFLTSEGLLALVTLTFLEIVLGVDNVIFISILAGKLPEDQQSRARRTGLLWRPLGCATPHADATQHSARTLAKSRRAYV